MNLLSLAPYGIAKFTYVFAVNVLESTKADCWLAATKITGSNGKIRFFELQALRLQAI
jgi:hypothetical protein